MDNVLSVYDNPNLHTTHSILGSSYGITFPCSYSVNPSYNITTLIILLYVISCMWKVHKNLLKFIVSVMD